MRLFLRLVATVARRFDASITPEQQA